MRDSLRDLALASVLKPSFPLRNGPVQHEVDHRDSDPCLGGFVQPLEVFGEPSTLVETGERALDDSALADYLEGLRFVAALDDVEEPVAEHGDLHDEYSCVSAICRYAVQSGPVITLASEQEQAAVAILHGGGKHRHREHESEGVDEHVPYGAFDLLPRVVTA